MSFRKQIEESKTFQAMQTFKRKIYTSSANIKAISEHIVIARNIGYDNWKAEHSPNHVELEVVKELI